MSLNKSVVLTEMAPDVPTASIHVNEVITALPATSCSVNIHTFGLFRPKRSAIRIQDSGHERTPRVLI
jgi:hypothetical protein